MYLEPQTNHLHSIMQRPEPGLIEIKRKKGSKHKCDGGQVLGTKPAPTKVAVFRQSIVLKKIYFPLGLH